MDSICPAIAYAELKRLENGKTVRRAECDSGWLLANPHKEE